MTDFEVVRLLDGGQVLLVLDGKANTGLGAPVSVPVVLEGAPARLIFRADGAKQRVLLTGDGNLYLGGNLADGDLVLFNGNATVPSKEGGTERATVHVDGGKPALTMRAPDGSERVHLDGALADLWIGGNGANGDIMLFHRDATDNRDASEATIRLNGFEGDIVLRNGDCAEEFDVDPAAGVAAGAVVALTDDGSLEVAEQPYDRRVAGVISGAGGLRPALLLGKDARATGRWPIALSGKVFCQADASYSPIVVGDLLTTSQTAGHAMAARDFDRAFGAVLGKALAPLDAGTGLIPVLVALQ